LYFELQLLSCVYLKAQFGKIEKKPSALYDTSAHTTSFYKFLHPQTARRDSTHLRCCPHRGPLMVLQDGQRGYRKPEFEIDEMVLAIRRRNVMGKFSLGRVTARRAVRTRTNLDECTVCQVAHFLTCGICCSTCAADSIQET